MEPEPLTLTLTREPAPSNGGGVRGTLTISASLSSPNSSPTQGRSGGVLGRLGRVSTLENAAYLIPCGTYPLEVTYSPRFKRMMPLVCNVPGRSGIRFHPGTNPEHSRGCILVSHADEDRLRELIQKEKVTLKIVQL